MAKSAVLVSWMPRSYTWKILIIFRPKEFAKQSIVPSESDEDEEDSVVGKMPSSDSDA